MQERTDRWRWTWCVVLLTGLCLAGNTARAEETPYEPGPVRWLHDWMGGYCTFAPDLDIGECCRLHDIAYQVGGSEWDRYSADIQFRLCILREGRPVVAEIYYWGVRTFGWLFFNYYRSDGLPA